jgi:quercetin dioxygenase-like cupin family protein
MKHLRYAILGGAAATMAASPLVTGPAFATPESSYFVTSVFNPAVVTGHYDALDLRAERVEKWSLVLKTRGSTDVGISDIQVGAGGHSGWHSNVGPIFVAVTSNEIYWYDGANPLCTFKVYQLGESFVVPANRVHLLRNAAEEDSFFRAVTISPTGVPFRVDAAKPTNCPTF